MSVVNVSSKAELLSALASASGGDTIRLEPGRYGSIALDGTKAQTRYLKYAEDVTIVSANVQNKAIISELNLKGVEHLKFQQINFDYSTATNSNGYPYAVYGSKYVTFRGNVFGGEYDADGYGIGVALKISQGSNILVENSIFNYFRKGIEGWGAEGLTVKGNTLNGISYDGLVMGHVKGLTIRDNTVTMKPNPAYDEHRDAIQIYNAGAVAPASDIRIENNRLYSPDTVTHGIFMGNADATSGALSEFYSNVVIKNNTVMTGQKLGIAIGKTNGLTIEGNTLIQHDARNDEAREITIPRLHVEKSALGVTVTDNILNGPLIASDQAWRAVEGGGSGWTVRDNAVVKLNWQIGQATTDPWANVQGNGEPDEFRFKGTWVASGDRTDRESDLSFDEGDTIVLINYEPGTFKSVWKGNPLNVSSAGDYAKIDSVTDLQELVGTSPKLAALVADDTLTLRVTQSGGVHDIVLDGIGQEYHSTYDSSLF